ncbi:MAG TPA: glycoside hydrolase family 3 N-terminal domain-containing protein [Methylomirabilota bacterium]|nr:glycoside hydrolase family 3 N-terminal domain-containing protein [Methylomirabilota bacterium]
MNSVVLALIVSLTLGGSGRPVAAPDTGLGAAHAAVAETTRPSSGATPSAAATPTLSQLIGQKLVVRMDGTTPSADLLGRIKRGEIGGVILMGFNITTRSALVALTGKLRAAAASGGQPPLLIAVDQEGGPIKRVPWAPPTLSPPEMGRLASTAVARDQGAKTGSALLGLGINVDFAPVADVPGSTSSFMYRDGRTFSFDASRTAYLSDAFATGLESQGVIPSMKHFPGIGLATRNTDDYVVTIRASATALALGLRPYRRAISHSIPLIMLSNATYTAYDPHYAAGWSRPIETLLRHDLGYTGATITDSLDGTAHARGLSTSHLALRAAQAGTDMILVTGSEATSRAVYATLLAGAQSGSIARTTLRASYDRIITLKSGL